MPRIRHSENGASRDYPLGDQPVTVGRAGRHTIPTMDARASRDHFAVEPAAGRWIARDLGSRNGTILNGQPLSAPATLRPGDRLQIGEATFEFVDDSPARAEAAPPPPAAPHPPAP
ncbi:MAG: FHA domain-containing protein, partial [Candidatus Brocadiae bacterium]|nr:FHA domain-containing protein [Candidatus Brocadiia bacterium]